MDIRERIESCVASIKDSAAELREIAGETENEQARNAFQQSAEKAEECAYQVQNALKQLTTERQR